MEQMKNEQIVFRCSKKLKEQMKHMAKTQDVVLSDYIRNACEVVMNEISRDNIAHDNLDGSYRLIPSSLDSKN